MSSALEWALRYRQWGWASIPAGGDKRPLIRWQEYQRRLPDVDEIRRWYNQWPTAGVAVITGSISGIVVLDVDPKNGGNQSLREFIAAGRISEDALKGPRVRTQSGGTHFYFAYPKDHQVPTMLGVRPGIDIKGDLGYVVAPPTMVPGTRRVWVWEVEP